MRKVWSAITGYFAQSEREAGPVTALYERLAAPPYGVLAGPMPVLLCAALLANDTRVALYEEGSFIPQLNMRRVRAAAPRPRTILRATMAVDRRSHDGIPPTRGTPQTLKSAATLTPDKADILTVVRPLCRFVTQSQRLCAANPAHQPRGQQIREHLTTATRPDKLVFEALPAACGIPPITSRAQLAEKELSRFITALRDGLGELHHCYDELLVDLTRSIGQAFGIDGRAARSACGWPSVRRRSGTGLPIRALKSFILRVADQSLDDLLWLESVVALLTQKPPSGWRDDDRAKFEVALTNIGPALRARRAAGVRDEPAKRPRRVRRTPSGSGSRPVPSRSWSV